MLFQDKKGRLLMSEEVDELSAFEIDELNLHLYEDEEREYN